MRIFKIYSLSNFQIVLIINYNHHAVHYVSMTYLFYNWIFFFGCATQLAGSEFPNQGLNPDPWHWTAQSSNHGVVRPVVNQGIPYSWMLYFFTPFTRLTPSSPYTHFSVCFHPSLDTLDCIHILVIINSAAVNMGVHISFQVSVLGLFL